VDYLLRQHNLSIPQTPSNEDQAPNWMRNGFNLFQRLEMLGYHTYPEAGADRQNLEVYPYASYAVLLGVLPFPKQTLEGRLQRQLALFERDVDVPDAMRILKYRHRLLKGVLPLEMLYPRRVRRLVAAYTAWLAALHSEKVTVLGDPQEGQVVLPGVDLKSRF
jgi:predicted RNase H-like nuclease